jgi:hypothetical protein
MNKQAITTDHNPSINSSTGTPAAGAARNQRDTRDSAPRCRAISATAFSESRSIAIQTRLAQSVRWPTGFVGYRDTVL